MLQKIKKHRISIGASLFLAGILCLSNIFAYATAYFSWNHQGSDVNAVIYNTNSYGNWGMMTSYERLSINYSNNTSVYRIYVHDYTTNNPYYVYYPSGTYIQMWVNGNYVMYYPLSTDIRVYGTGYYQWFAIDVTLKNGVSNEIKLYNSDGGGVQTRYFTPPSPTFYVYYDGNGGTNVPATTKFAYNSGATISSQIPYKEGYQFDCWTTTDGDGRNFSPGAVIPEGWGTFHLTAKWTVKEYTIHFDTNGGSLVEDQKVTYELLVQEPSPPIKSNFIFGGWYRDVELSQPYDFKTKVDRNFTLYAKWLSMPKITTKYDRYYLVQEKFDKQDIQRYLKALDEYGNDISDRIEVLNFDTVKIGEVGDYTIIAKVRTSLGYEASAPITIHISDSMSKMQLREIALDTMTTLHDQSKWSEKLTILKTKLEEMNVLYQKTIHNE